MRYLNSFNVIATVLLAIAFNSSAYAGAITGTTGTSASSYKVTVSKVELCRSSACSNPFVLGQATKVFDIASAAVGSDVGNYISLKNIPLYQTWTHVRVTLSTDFTITANNGTCMTNGNTSANRGAWAAGTGAGAAGTETASVLKLPNEALVKASIPGFTYTTYGIVQTDDATQFTMTVALSTPYVCKGVMPRVAVKFDTSEAFGYTAGCGQMFPQPPTITITAFDP